VAELCPTTESADLSTLVEKLIYHLQFRVEKSRPMPKRILIRAMPDVEPTARVAAVSDQALHDFFPRPPTSHSGFSSCFSEASAFTSDLLSYTHMADERVQLVLKRSCIFFSGQTVAA